MPSPGDETGSVDAGLVQKVLESHESVRQCVVIRVQVGAEGLVAFVVGDHTASSLTLGAYLRQMLPDQSIPVLRYARVDSIPLAPDGNPDREALVRQYECDDMTRSHAASVMTPTEEVILEIFGDALQSQEISLRDTFFDLGGYSLLANRIILNIESKLGVRIPDMQLFTCSLGQIAATCEQELKSMGRTGTETSSLQSLDGVDARSPGMIKRIRGWLRQGKDR